MSKPINVEAQRVYKILQETVEKLKVLSLLNKEFFDEVFGKEEEELKAIFGNEIGILLYYHANYERTFIENNIDGNNKMITFTDELMTDEKKQIALNLRKSTSSLVRHFKLQQMQLKLKSIADTRSNEYAGLIESFEQLKILMQQKLTTSQEEETSIKDQLRLLTQKTTKLKEIRDSKKEHLQKYEEETKEQKEQREHEITNLKKMIGDETSTKDNRLKDLNDTSSSKSDILEKRHKLKVDQLKARIIELDKNLTEYKVKNKTDEDKLLRQDFKKAETNYQEMLANYDTDMRDHIREKDKAFAEFQESHHDLEQVSEDYKQRLEERKKREEILAIMKKKNDEQQKQLDLMNRASEWLQAHWKGLLARREMEKARKGKKKKKKKK